MKKHGYILERSGKLLSFGVSSAHIYSVALTDRMVARNGGRGVELHQIGPTATTYINTVTFSLQAGYMLEGWPTHAAP